MVKVIENGLRFGVEGPGFSARAASGDGARRKFSLFQFASPVAHV
jgi:hypothetical protein